MTRTLGEPMPLWERRAWLILLVVAAALRLWQLGDRAFHHDESIHANFAMQLAHQGTYKYDPVYHGPIQYYAVASTFRILGDTDFTARFPAALGGVALCAMALLLRPRYGPWVALVSGGFLAISPNFLYFTRFCREDIWSLLGTAGIFLYFDSYLRTRRIRDIALAAFAAAVAFAAKETFYVLCALMVPSVAAVWLEPGRGREAWNRVRRLVDFLEEHQAALAGALCLFFVLSELFYTVFLIRPESGNPAVDAITYWYGQHKMERVSGPKTYYLPRLLQYEFLILVPALILIVTRWRKFGAAERFLAGWGISSLLMYGYLGEKTPWLVVHQVLPFIPIAAIAWVDWWTTSPRLQVVGAAALLATLVSSLSLSFWLSTITPASRKAESVIYVQTCPEVLGLVDEILAFGKVGAVPAAIVAGEAGWPMTWYVRKAPVNWEMPKPDLKAPIVICDQGQADEAAKILGPGYRKTEVPYRGWWVPETSFSPLHPTPGELLKYLFTREVWQGELEKSVNPIGSMYVAVFRRTEPIRPPAPPPPAEAAPAQPSAQPPASP
jgi:uncharacterized protein (TIGR03663 family)